MKLVEVAKDSISLRKIFKQFKVYKGTLSTLCRVTVIASARARGKVDAKTETETIRLVL